MVPGPARLLLLCLPFILAAPQALNLVAESLGLLAGPVQLLLEQPALLLQPIGDAAFLDFAWGAS